MPSSSAAVVVLSDEEREQLERWTRRRSSAQALALRSRIVLLAAEGLRNTEIAERLGISRPPVTKWRNRFVAHRLDGLWDERRPGRPRVIGDEKVEEVIVKTLESTRKDATHWSTRSMAAEVGLSREAVGRIWRAFGLQPHPSETWKLSRAPLVVMRSATSSACPSPRPSARSCCASMRSHRFRRRPAPRRSCRLPGVPERA